MAYVNFKPLIWSQYIQHELEKFTVFEKDCNYQFKGEVGMGKTVKILGVARPTIGYYTGASIGTPETVPDTSVSLAIDNFRFFNFQIDDVDEAQATEGLMQALMTESTRGLAEIRDDFIAEDCAKAANKISATTSVTSAATAKAALDTAITTLWTNGLSTKDSITAYLTPQFYQFMKDYIVETVEDKQMILSGVMGKYSGVTIKMTNNAFNDSTDDYIVVKSDKAYAFASCIESVEAYRPETLFSDAIKGLNSFGGKAVRPKEIYTIKAHYTA